MYEKQTFVVKLLDPFCICRQNTGNVYFFELNEKSTRLTSLLTIWNPKTVQIQSNPFITTSSYATPRI